MNQPMTNAEKQAAFRRRRDAQAKAWAQLQDAENIARIRSHMAQSEAEEPGTAAAILRFKEAYIKFLANEPDTAEDDPRILLARIEVEAARDCIGARFTGRGGITKRIRFKSGEEIDAPR